MDAVRFTTDVSYEGLPVCLIRMADMNGTLLAQNTSLIGKHVLTYILRIYCASSDPKFTENIFFIISKSNIDVTSPDREDKHGQRTQEDLHMTFTDDMDTSIHWDVKIIDIPKDAEKVTYVGLSTDELIHLMSITDYDTESICITIPEDESPADDIGFTKQDLIRLPSRSNCVKFKKNNYNYFVIPDNNDDYLPM